MWNRKRGKQIKKLSRRGSVYSSLNISSNMKQLNGAAPCIELVMTGDIHYMLEKL